MQQQHNKNWQDGWLNQTFIDITDDVDLDDIPDDIPDDIRAQSAVSFPPSVMTDGDNMTEPPTPADAFRPITPSPEKNPCQTPATELSFNANLHYLSRDVLDDFDSQTLGDYDNLNWVKMFVGLDTEQNDNQPMSVESYDDYNYRNGPTSCSSVTPHDSESLERVKRKAVSPADDELIEIVHAKRRRLTESSSQPRLSDEFDSLNKRCTRNVSHLNTDHTRTFCQGRSQKQRTLEARHRHSSLPDSGHLQTTGSTIHPLGTLGSTLLHPSGTFPVDVNGNFCVQLVTTSNNARPQSRLLPPVSSFCGTEAINTPGPASPYPVLGTETLPSPNVDTLLSLNVDTLPSLNVDTLSSLNVDTLPSLNVDTLPSLNVDTLSSLNVDTLPSLNVDTLLSIIQTSQTTDEALRHLDGIHQNTSILHSVYPSSDHSGHSLETSSNELHHVTHQSPSHPSFTCNENNFSPTTINHHCHPLVSNSQSDMLPLVSNSQSDMLPLVSNSQSDMLPLISNSQSDMLHLVSNSQSDMLHLVSNCQSDMLHLVSNSQSDMLHLVSNSQSDMLHLVSNSQSDMMPIADVVDIDIASTIVSGVIDNLCLTEITTHGMENFMTHLTPVPRMVSTTLLQSPNKSGHHQITAVPSPDPSYLPQTSVPSPRPSYQHQTPEPSYQTPEPTPGPSYLPQTSVPTPSHQHQTSEPTPGPSYLHNISAATNGPNCVSPKLAAKNDPSLIAQLPTDTLDPHLAETYQKACRQNSTEGLTKYILRTRILLRKNNWGQADIETNSEPQVKYEMTPEELEKSQQRRELNRLSAAKHRLTKKQKIEKNEQEHGELSTRKHELEEMVKSGTDEKNMLISCLLGFGLSMETIHKALQ